MQYDKQVFAKFRELAVTNPLLLVPGKTYYSNSYPEEFTVKKLISARQLYEARGVPIMDSDSDELNWIVYGDSPYDTCAMTDRNIGGHYSPWLVFEDKETRDRCKEELVTSYALAWEDDILEAFE